MDRAELVINTTKELMIAANGGKSILDPQVAAHYGEVFKVLSSKVAEALDKLSD